jgi:hypothetical protein
MLEHRQLRHNAPLTERLENARSPTSNAGSMLIAASFVRAAGSMTFGAVRWGGPSVPDEQPIVGANACEAHHVGYALSGILHIRTERARSSTSARRTPTRFCRAMTLGGG